MVEVLSTLLSLVEPRLQGSLSTRVLERIRVLALPWTPQTRSILLVVPSQTIYPQRTLFNQREDRQPEVTMLSSRSSIRHRAVTPPYSTHRIWEALAKTLVVA